MRLCIAKVVISPAQVRAFKQERRALARRGVRKRICKGDNGNIQETAAAGAGEPHRNRGSWGSVGSVPSNRAVALRIHFREPRGLTPAPLLVVGRMSLNGARFFQHAARVT
jgi:hypothetical protein